MKTLLDHADYQRILTRFHGLRPDTPALWGRMTAPHMLVHLGDCLRQTLGDTRVAPRKTRLGLPIVRHVVMYWLPWPKGKVKGPREFFVTLPSSWTEDLATLEALLTRFVGETTRSEWPDHAFFGAMNHRSWGRFTHRHFDHHLRQFGA